ncbi:FkbM family methyltransferase [Mycolicibacterium sp.]|uniref:FkbM family methyltransferase n=1 Tax=Mycolicibacterium sp. TaxID=2320850 RepID=UPI001A291DCF|nr:FkbM family methyltransferase [Mycolicibacterium sp.]MBJ7339074.1 FkbM family methyltransferase [Mycolicibacterium sp.]
MQIGGRNVSTLAKSMLEPRHYIAAGNMARTYEAPVEMARRYLSNKGEYPYTAKVRTPTSLLALRTYSPHDVLTINEIFCRQDYKADAGDKVVVDFGSNIGISAAYFLSRGPGVFAYLFEPLPSNVERLRDNLRVFPDQYVLQETAVGPDEGEVQFGWEDTGRYGGVGVATGKTITVPCVKSRSVLEDVVGRHGRIDVLKADIEGLEGAIVADIPEDLARSIGKIYVEYVFSENPLPATHDFRQYGDIAQLTLR